MTHPFQGSLSLLHCWVMGTRISWSGVTSGTEAKRHAGEEERLEESSPALAGWPLTATHLQLQLTMSPESTCSGHHCTHQWSGTKRQRMHELPSIQQDWAARFASPSPLPCLATQAWPKYDVPEWDTALAAPGEVAALSPPHSLYLFLFFPPFMLL